MENLKKIINKDILSHKFEIEESRKLMDKIQIDLAKYKNNLTNPDASFIIKAGKLAVLKDKIIFHSACMTTLDKVLGDING